MDSVGTLFDQVHDLVDASAATVVNFAGASCNEAAADHGEHQSVKKFLVFLIKRAIYENAQRGNLRHLIRSNR